ncbi:MAG TPA: hypothetical protein VHF65_03015 [Nitrososphaera sp.]|nr:hypothetical protein [Nitrososphaera sp.]
MLKSLEVESGKLWLVVIPALLIIVSLGVSMPFEQAYAISPSFSTPVCYGMTYSGLCVHLEHPLIMKSELPLITVA